MCCFYRVVSSDPAPRDEFRANRERGVPPTRPERLDPEIYDGISVWDTLGAAGALARTMKRSHVAQICLAMLPQGERVLVRKTFSPGHFTLIRNADVLSKCVMQVRAVQ